VGTRPYSKFRIDELETLYAKSAQDDAVVEKLSAELVHRTTARAIRLAAKLRKGQIARGATPSDATIDDLPKGLRARLRPANEDLAADAIADPCQEYRTRYEVLRTTFTLEAEWLARWGMTGAMPLELQGKVFDLWKATLSEVPDLFGRTQQQLERDQSQLAVEQKLAGLKRRPSKKPAT